MIVRASLLSALPLWAILSACTPARAPAAAPSEAEIARVIDDWHDAAARADEERYFGHIADRGVFLGTDMTERWDKAAFRAYAHPHFAKGKAWSFRSVERHVRFDDDGRVAWFDERLETPNLGPARGSGVLVRTDAGAWKIAHYDLSVPIPNEKFSDVKALIAK
jgi:ketosteroid isomerase-like protein